MVAVDFVVRALAFNVAWRLREPISLATHFRARSQVNMAIPKKAAPRKPERKCKDAGLLVPVIDRNRCEGKAECVRVCPYSVFEIVQLSNEQRASLSFLGRLKSAMHGHRQAFAIRADQCHACSLCVAACPEQAITLARF